MIAPLRELFAVMVFCLLLLFSLYPVIFQNLAILLIILKRLIPLLLNFRVYHLLFVQGLVMTLVRSLILFPIPQIWKNWLNLVLLLSVRNRSQPLNF